MKELEVRQFNKVKRQTALTFAKRYVRLQDMTYEPEFTSLPDAQKLLIKRSIDATGDDLVWAQTLQKNEDVGFRTLEQTALLTRVKNSALKSLGFAVCTIVLTGSGFWMTGSLEKGVDSSIEIGHKVHDILVRSDKKFTPSLGDTSIIDR